MSTDSLLSSCLSSTHPQAQKVHLFYSCVTVQRPPLCLMGASQPHFRQAVPRGAATPSSGQTGASQFGVQR